MTFKQWALLGMLLVVRGLSAQSTGTIAGAVKDPSGGVVSSVRVSVQSATGLSREVETGESGEFAVPLLPPGVYTVAVEKTGFRRIVRNDVTLDVNQAVRLDFVLMLGEVAQVVRVEEQAPIIESDTSTRGQILDGTKVLELPLNARNFLAFALLAPGVQPPADGSFNSSQGLSVSVNGAREEANNFLLDGVDNNDMSTNLYTVLPSLEAIREFKVQGSTSSAEYGRNAGAQVNVILKGGSNDFHGSVFEFLRNRHLDARNFFDRPDCAPTSLPGSCGEIPRFDRNQFGGTFSGPLVHERTFFFGAYEGLRLDQAITRRSTVPSQSQRAAAIAAVPAGERNAAGVAMLNFIPVANVGGNLATSNTLLAAPTLSDGIDEASIKIDHALDLKNSIGGHYAFTREHRFNPFDLLFPFTSLPGFGSRTSNRSQSARLSWTHVFSSRLVSDLRLGFNRMHGDIRNQNSGNNISRQLNFPENSNRMIDLGSPNITLAGFDPIGEPINLPQKRVVNTYQFAGTIAWNPSFAGGRHQFKFGTEIRPLQWNVFLDLYARGQWAFLGGGSGNPLIDLVRGRPDFAVAGRGETDLALRTKSWSFYVQDDVRVNDSLTLNVGLRYEYNSPPTDTRQRLSTPDLSSNSLTCSPAPACQFFREGSNGVSRGIYEKDLNNFAPRIGLAWRPTASDRLVVRSAYGVFYDVGVLNRNLFPRFNPPFFQVGIFLNDGTRSIQDILQQSSSSPSLAFTVARDHRDAYMQDWNLGVQYELRPGWVLDVGYVGSKGTRLLIERDLNQPLPGPGPRPYPAFASFRHIESNGASSYNSLQARTEWRLRSGLEFLTSYTWSKSIDDASALVVTLSEPAFPQDSHNVRANRSLSTFHTAHRLSQNAIFDLPFGEDGRWMKSATGWKKDLLSDWKVGGILTVQSGRPFTINRAIPQSATSADFGVFDRPDAIADPYAAGPVLANPDPACHATVSAGGRAADRVHSPAAWFNPCAFAAPSTPRFGTAGRNSIIGPAFGNFDLLISKNMFLGKKQRRLELRAEFFNLSNHANFDIPDRIFDSPTFGAVLSSNAFGSKPSRQIQLGLKYIF